MLTSGRIGIETNVRYTSLNDYSWPTDPIIGHDLSGEEWFDESWWRGAATIGALVAGVAGAVACGVTVVCALAVGAAAGAAMHLAQDEFSNRFTWSGLTSSTLLGAIGGVRAGTVLKTLARSSSVKKPISVGHRAFRLHFDQKPHGKNWFTQRSHWQINTWTRGGTSNNGGSFSLLFIFDYHKKYLK